MGKLGGFDMSGLLKFQKELQKLQEFQKPDEFVESCAKELTARLLRLVVKRTPTGVYSKEVNFKTKKGKMVSFTVHTGKTGGTLKRGWTGRKNVPTSLVDELTVHYYGGTYIIEIVNNVEYASYVEYGHRTINGGWVPGRFMMTISENQLRRIAPAVLEAKIQKYLGGLMK